MHIDILYSVISFRYSKRQKEQEVHTLTAGLEVPAPPMTASDPLPKARHLLASRSSATVTSAAPQVTPSPATSVLASHSASSPYSIQPLVPQFGPIQQQSRTPVNICPQPVSQPPVILNPQTAPYIQLQYPYLQTPYVPPTTAWYRKKRETQSKRNYNRTKQYNTCKLCKKPLLKLTGHIKLHGFQYCEENPMPFHEWKAMVEEKIRINKEKKAKPDNH